MKRWIVVLMALWLAGCIYMPVHGEDGRWSVYHKVYKGRFETFDGKLECVNLSLANEPGIPMSYTALLYGDEFMEVINCETPAQGRETVRILKQVAALMNKLDKEHSTMRWTPEEKWTPEN